MFWGDPFDKLTFVMTEPLEYLMEEQQGKDPLSRNNKNTKWLEYSNKGRIVWGKDGVESRSWSMWGCYDMARNVNLLQLQRSHWTVWRCNLVSFRKDHPCCSIENAQGKLRKIGMKARNQVLKLYFMYICTYLLLLLLYFAWLVWHFWLLMPDVHSPSRYLYCSNTGGVIFL